MITFLHLIALALVAFGILPASTLVLVPLYCIWWIGRGLLKGAEEVDAKQLTVMLAYRWNNPEELAAYMVRYWPALKYAGSATSRQRTCTSLALLQISVGMLVLWKASTIIGLAMIVEGAILWMMATKVNRPLSMYKDSRVRSSLDTFCRTEWRNAVSSMIAYAELNPHNANAGFLASHLLRDTQVASELTTVRKL